MTHFLFLLTSCCFCSFRSSCTSCSSPFKSFSFSCFPVALLATCLHWLVCNKVEIHIEAKINVKYWPSVIINYSVKTVLWQILDNLEVKESWNNHEWNSPEVSSSHPFQWCSPPGLFVFLLKGCSGSELAWLDRLVLLSWSLSRYKVCVWYRIPVERIEYLT